MNKSICILTLITVITACVYAEEAAENAASNQKVYSIEECVAYAVEHRPDIRRSRIAMQRAEWRVLTQKAKYAFDLSATNTRDIDDETDSQSLTLNRTFPMDLDVRATVSQSDTGNEGTASLRISKVILGGGSLDESNKGIQDSLISELTTQNEHFQKIQQLNLQITRAYYRVVRSKQTLTIQLRQLESSKTNRERAVERDRLLDIANADIQVSENEERVLQAKLGIESSRDNLKKEIGMPIYDEITVSDEFEIILAKHNLADDWEFAQANHVDFVNFDLELKKIERDIGIERSQLLPTVSVDYNVSRDSADSFDLEGDIESSVGVTLSWQFGAVEDRSAYHQAILSKQESDIEFYDLTQRKMLELRNLDRELVESMQRIHLAEERLKLQERSTALYADRWENGEIDILEYIRNQDALENSRVNLLRLNIEYIEKLAEYRFAVGR